jgi:hypothetical protein
MPNILARLIAFFRRGVSVNVILGDFNKIVARLDGHIEAQSTAVKVADATIGKAQKARDAATATISRAANARAKIREITGA